MQIRVRILVSSKPAPTHFANECFIETQQCTPDPTLFSSVREAYHNGVVHLLGQNSCSGLSQEDLVAFKDEFGPSAFVCHIHRCNRSVVGYASASLLRDHEARHQGTLKCPVSSCLYGLDFTSSKQLKAHMRKRHPAPGATETPSRIRREIPTAATMDQLQPGIVQAQIGQPPAMPPHGFTVTPQELAQVRSQKPQFAHMPDDKLRQMLLNIKRQTWQNHMRQQQQARNQGQQPAGAAGLSVSQAPMQPQPVMPTSQPGQAQAQRGAIGQTAPMQANNDQKPQVAAAEQVTNNNRGNKKGSTQPMPSPAQAGKTLKRSSDDLADGAATPSQQQQPRRPSQSQGPKSQPSPEEQKKRQMAGGQTPGQQPAQMQGSDNLARLKVIGQEEQRSFSQQTMPDIPMSPQEHAGTAERLERIVLDMSKIGRGLSRWYALTQDDTRARLFFKTVSIRSKFPTLSWIILSHS